MQRLFQYHSQSTRYRENTTAKHPLETTNHPACRSLNIPGQTYTSLPSSREHHWAQPCRQPNPYGSTPTSLDTENRRATLIARITRCLPGFFSILLYNPCQHSGFYKETQAKVLGPQFSTCFPAYGIKEFVILHDAHHFKRALQVVSRRLPNVEKQVPVRNY